MFYKELLILSSENRLEVAYKRLGQTIKKEILSKELSGGHWHFKELTRGGQTKYLLQFENHKLHDLLVLKNLEI